VQMSRLTPTGARRTASRTAASSILLLVVSGSAAELADDEAVNAEDHGPTTRPRIIRTRPIGVSCQDTSGSHVGQRGTDDCHVEISVR
jgi:hypothetical protein